MTLDTVVEVYRDGSTPEEIARHYPSLNLADVYAVLTYYLRHQPEVDAYLLRRQEEAAAIRHEAEVRLDRQGLREKLLARLAGRSGPMLRLLADENLDIRIVRALKGQVPGFDIVRDTRAEDPVVLE